MTDRDRALAIVVEDPRGAPASGAVLRVRDALAGIGSTIPVDVATVQPVARTRARRVAAGLRLVPEAIASVDHTATARSLRVAGDRVAFAYVAGPSLLATARAALPDVPIVVDMFDVPSHLHAAHLETQPHQSALARWRGRLDVRAWRRFERKLADPRVRVVVASDDDAARLHPVGCAVIPNGYPTPTTVDTSHREPATMLFVGHLAYPPNADAVEALLSTILPLVRLGRPDAQLLVVGRGGGRNFAPADGVEVHLDVDSTTPFYERASVVVAPVRYGTGTRVKLLEAFAHRVPVVAHPIAAEGLLVEDTVHLRLASTPAAMADRVLECLADDGVARRKMTDAAYDLFLRRYESSVVRSAWAALADRILHS